jgi:hypothetical protein
MSKYISAAFFRDVVNRQRDGREDEGISFDYMLNLIEDEVIKNYTQTLNTNEE